MIDDITLELARLEREVHERVRQRDRDLNKGEAFAGLESLMRDFFRPTHLTGELT